MAPRRSTSTARHIEKDAALERRFQPVLVGEPTVEDTISILRGLRERYEVHHKVRIQDSALVAAAVLSNRYIADRFLPDKAIDLVDEAASKLRMEITSMPVELDEVERRIMQLEIEREALRKEKDQASIDRLGHLEHDLATSKEQRDGLRSKWDQERQVISSISELRDEMDKTRTEIEQAQRAYDYNRAAELQYGRLVDLGARLAEEERRLVTLQEAGQLLKEEVDSEDIADVVGRWTGIPVARLMEGEMEKLLRWKSAFISGLSVRMTLSRPSPTPSGGRERAERPQPASRLVPVPWSHRRRQDRAGAVARGLPVRQRSGHDPDRHERVHGEAHRQPPGRCATGIRGYDEGGQLSESVRRRPYSVVLFDEVEKAHPDVFNVLLQVLDDGRLTDGQGRTVDFRNTVIIMTSNLGSSFLTSGDVTDQARAQIMELLRGTFRPEFLNRIDETIIFSALSREQLAEIVGVQLEIVSRRLAERSISLSVTPAARDWLALRGYDPVYGARPLKRLIQKDVLDPLAMRLLSGKLHDGEQVVIDVDAGGSLAFHANLTEAPLVA